MQYEGHTLRHEYKYYMNYDMYYVLRDRLKKVIQMDAHMQDENGYLISSIYFDDIYHSAVEEKHAGTGSRKKFRIRSYERDPRLIRLECKSKYNEYISKISANLSPEEYNQIMKGDYACLQKRKELVCRELFGYHSAKFLRPTVVVDYVREAYILPTGNVRITFDKDISASVQTLDMFSEDYQTKKVLPDDMMVLEVKYDDYLPAHIKSILKSACADRCAISKYVMCREERRRVNFL